MLCNESISTYHKTCLLRLKLEIFLVKANDWEDYTLAGNGFALVALISAGAETLPIGTYASESTYYSLAFIFVTGGNSYSSEGRQCAKR